MSDRLLEVFGSILLVLCAVLGAATLGIIAAKYVMGAWTVPL
jgi:hypothetical protein